MKNKNNEQNNSDRGFKHIVKERAARAEQLEPVRALANDLILKRSEGITSIAITSYCAKQGKTELVESLGELLAKSGYKTLMIDGNYFSPNLTRRYLLESKHGLLNLLDELQQMAEEKEEKLGSQEENVVQAETNTEDTSNTDTEKGKEESAKESDAEYLNKYISLCTCKNLSILPMGTIQEDEDFIVGANMKQAVEDLKNRFDFVIVETPSFEHFSYVQSICQYIDGTSLILRAGSLKISEAQEVKEKIDKLTNRCLGCILNKQKKQKQRQQHCNQVLEVPASQQVIPQA